MRWAVLLFPFYWQENWGTEHLRDFPGLQCRDVSLVSLDAEAPGLTAALFRLWIKPLFSSHQMAQTPGQSQGRGHDVLTLKKRFAPATERFVLIADELSLY